MARKWPCEWQRCPRTFGDPRRERWEGVAVSGRPALTLRLNSLKARFDDLELRMIIITKSVGWARETLESLNSYQNISNRIVLYCFCYFNISRESVSHWKAISRICCLSYPGPSCCCWNQCCDWGSTGYPSSLDVLEIQSLLIPENSIFAFLCQPACCYPVWTWA